MNVAFLILSQPLPCWLVSRRWGEAWVERDPQVIDVMRYCACELTRCQRREVHCNDAWQLA